VQRTTRRTPAGGCPCDWVASHAETVLLPEFADRIGPTAALGEAAEGAGLTAT